MKKFILAVPALLALAAVSCTKSEVLESNDGEIRFNVVANNATKAEAIYCNNNKPGEFTVYAESSDGKTYINGDVITSTDGGTNWVNTSGTRFWPNDLSLDFYAVVNGEIDWNVEAAEGTAPASIVDFEVPTNVTAQKDLLYAVKTDQAKADGADKMEPVELNFRHALSQIVFNAKNTNENLYVEVSGVSIVNVANKNTFTFPVANTDNNMEDGDHDGSFNNTINYEDGSWGKWNTLTSGATVYSVNFATVKVEGNNNNTLVDLTTNATVKDEYNTNALLMLPQTSTAWNPVTVPSPGLVGNASNGSYFLVNCAIYNVSGDSFDPDVDTPLWASQAEHKQVAIPMTINWEQGKKYIYTFIFGEGGGYIPDPDPDPDPDPVPVLIPVTFEVTVDDFVEVPATDVEMSL